MASYFGTLLHKGIALIAASLFIVRGFFTPLEITINHNEKAAPANETTTTIQVLAPTSSVMGASSTNAIATSTNASSAKKEKIQPSVKNSPMRKAAAPAYAGPITADEFLKRTEISLNQRMDGTYWPEFKTNLTGFPVNPADLKWNPLDGAVGGSGPIPKFNIVFDCSPMYDQSPDALFSPIVLKIITSYSCTLTLADAASRKTQKRFDFETGAGLLTVSKPHGALDSNRLRTDVSNSGVVFVNTDDSPIAIKGLTFNIAATAVNVAGNLAAIRFSDLDGNILNTYFIKDIPQNSSKPYFYSQNGINTALSLQVKPHSGMVLVVSAVNIPILYTDVNPDVQISFTDITTDRNDITIKSFPINIEWTCIPKYLPDDPDSMCH